MSIRTYNHSEYDENLKLNLRHLVNSIITERRINYVEYFLPISISTINYYGPIICSYLELDFEDDLTNMIVSEFIIIRLINLFTIEKKEKQQQIEYNPKDFRSDKKLPSNLIILSSIIPEETSYTFNSLFKQLLPEVETKDVRFSLTGKDEEWGDYPPDIITCIYTSIYEEMENIGIYIGQKKRAFFTKTENVSISCSNADGSEDMIIIFLGDVRMKGEECNYWAKKEPSSFEVDINKGSVLIFKKDSYYNWKYNFTRNSGMLVLK